MIKRQTITSVDEDVESLEPSYTDDENVNGTATLGKSGSFLKG